MTFFIHFIRFHQKTKNTCCFLEYINITEGGINVNIGKMGLTRSRPMLKVVLLTKNAKLPTKATAGSAGFDLYSAEEKDIPKNGRAIIKTDLSIQIPSNTYARIAARSGLSIRNGLQIGGGICDSDFRGNISVIIFNHSNTNFSVEKGDRIAQMVIEKISQPQIIEVTKLRNTGRDRDGFGSTGIK